MTVAVDANWTVEGRVLLFPPASDPLRQGFVRVTNRSNRKGDVRIHPIDDTGWTYDAVTLAVDANQTVHFNSEDFEAGNPDKGLSSATGPGEGYWRLDFSSELEIDVLSYIRTGDGFLTAMHDIVLQDEGDCRVAIFNPGSNPNQVSILRLVNLGQEDAAVTIRGTDDKGNLGLGEVHLTIDARAAANISAQELETGSGALEGMLGDGTGKWRLVVESDQPVVAMNLLESPTGHLTNLSTVPLRDPGRVHRVPLFPAAGDASARQGFVRVINRSPNSGEVRVRAHDDSDRTYAPVTFPIGGEKVVHFNSDDLEQGDRKGLSAGTGAGDGDWRLEVTSDLDIEVLAYIRTQDGFLTSMHDVAPHAGNLHRVVIFNPGSNPNQISRLRLVNEGEVPAPVVIEGMDDLGDSPGSRVETLIPPGAVREIETADLEAGNDVDGALGDGSGKWRLIVESVESLVVMSLLESPTGHLANLSSDVPRWDPLLIEDHYVETTLGAVAGVSAALVDGEGFEPGEHGQRITDVFLANTDRATLVQMDGWGEYQHHGVTLRGINSNAYVRHALRNGTGIFFTATDDSPPFSHATRNQWFMVDDRPFYATARTFARWARHENVLFVGSLENGTGTPNDAGGYDALYCDDFDSSAEDWIPLCDAFLDYVAHTGNGIENVVLVGAIDRFGAGNAAIRANGVFAPHTIYVESPDGSTSQATPVLAAYAANLAFANPKWGAARLKRELMDLAREETIEYGTGRATAGGTELYEQRTVKIIRPSFAPAGANR
ncbi:MAG: hypothetical protein OXQ29_27495 [Rhodospirillaceae bacterium]|nr:hypothetical protein [Rhodospirillaceae bacterium]